MTEKVEVAETIRRLVAESGEVHGSKLAIELRATFPDWRPSDSGARNLREFVATHVEGVGVVGRSGLDVVYGKPITSTPPEPRSSTTAGSDASCWRAWVSPGSPLALSISEDGTTTLIKRSSEPPSGHVYLEPTSIEDHRSLARSYIADCAPKDSQPRLERIAASNDAKWWRLWLDELKKRGSLSSWNAYRHQGLRELLESRLQNTNLSEAARNAAVRAIVGSRTIGRKTIRTEAKHDRGLRQVVLAALERMSDNELRELRLPVGVVVDVLAEAKS